jgi:hypothetical protein
MVPNAIWRGSHACTKVGIAGCMMATPKPVTIDAA